MPQQKRKASAIASAKIAEEAVSGRKRKSDAKEQRPSTKETNDDNKDEIEENVSDDKPADESPDNKRRKKKQSNVEENHDQQHGNGANGNNEQGLDLDNPHQMVIDKHAEPQAQAVNEEVGQQDKTDKTQPNEIKKELEKQMAPNTLEKGHVCFLYRPKVGTEEVDSIEEVQRLYLVLIPYMVRNSVSEEPTSSYFQQALDDKLTDSDKPIPGKTRIIVVSKKELPDIEKHTKLWAFVDKAFTNLDDIKGFVTEKKYQTKTRGERSIGTCRLLGKGVYSIVEHKGHSHLAYVLEFPEEPSEVQDVFKIEQEGSYVINIKNPETKNPPYAGLSDNEKVKFPTHLSEKFGGRRFVSLSTPEFLDYDGAEFLFIGARKNVAEELGEAGEELEELAEFETKNISALEAERAIYEELHLEKEILPSEPLHGLWK